MKTSRDDIATQKKEENMEKEIYVSRENASKLAKVFNTSRQTVWSALNFKTESVLARRIRYTALKEFDGVASWKPTEFDTYFDEAGRMMVQTFGNGVKIVVSLETSTAMLGVERNGETQGIRTEVKNCTVEQLMRLQGEAVKMSMSM